jgi:hypothetical protein
MDCFVPRIKSGNPRNKGVSIRGQNFESTPSVSDVKNIGAQDADRSRDALRRLDSAGVRRPATVTFDSCLS